MKKRPTRKNLLNYGSWYFILHSLLTLPVSLLYFKHINLSFDLLTFVYLFLLTISHFTFLNFIIYLGIYVPVALIIPRKKILQILILILLTTTLTTLIIDTYVYKLYRFHINSFTLNLLFGGNALEIFDLHYLIYIIGIVFIGGIFVIEIFVLKLFNKLYNRNFFRYGWIIFIAMTLMILSSHLIHAWAEAAYYKPITKSSRLFPLFMPLQASDFFYNNGIVDKEKSKYSIDKYLNDESALLNYPQNSIASSDTLNTPNILFILIDSWHYKTMDSIITPNIASFTKKSSQFTNHYSGSNGTRTGIFSLFYSIPGTYWYDFLSALKGPIFIDELIKRNYDIELLANASLHNPPFDRTVFIKIDSVRKTTKGDNVNKRDIQITSEWLEFANNHHKQKVKKPFFGFLFYDSPHSISHPSDYKGPCQPEWEYAKYQELNNDTDPTKFFNLYKNSVNFCDSLIGIILSDLQDKNMLKNTIVILTGDHGQEFNDNKKNFWGHNGNYSQAQLGVPCIIYIPDEKPQLFNHWTSHYDIVPTIMQNAFKITNPPEDYSIGKNIFTTTNRDWLVVGSNDNFGIIEPDRITNVYYDRSYDITTRNLENLDTAKLRINLFNNILQQLNRFYIGNKKGGVKVKN